MYINNKYAGYISRELKYIYRVENGPLLRRSTGDLYILEKTVKEGKPAGYFIDSVSICEFSFEQNGKVVKSSDNFKFPMISGVPFFPERDIKHGETIDSTGDAVFDITKDLNDVMIPIFCQTTYAGKKTIYAKECDYFRINYGYSVMKGDVIRNAAANHRMDFYFDPALRLPFYMEDHFTEEFTMINNGKIRRSGFHLYFYSKISGLDRDKIIHELKITDDASEDKDESNDLTFEKREDGVAVIINNLQFKPDTAELLDEEKEKLLALYEMLSKIKNRTFKIIGHTVKSGTESGQMRLSIERAKSIALFLINKGMDPERIIYTGKGAAEPIAPNDTEDNMRKNRRVEIIIMED